MFTENMITLEDAAKLTPVPGGRSKSSLYRWWRYGYNGVKLECRRVGRSLFTSRDAVERFAAKLAAAGAAVPAEAKTEELPTAPAAVRVPVSVSGRKKVHRPAFDAQSILERAGILGASAA